MTAERTKDFDVQFDFAPNDWPRLTAFLDGKEIAQYQIAPFVVATSAMQMIRDWLNNLVAPALVARLSRPPLSSSPVARAEWSDEVALRELRAVLRETGDGWWANRSDEATLADFRHAILFAQRIWRIASLSSPDAAAGRGVDPEFKRQYEALVARQDEVKREAAREALTKFSDWLTQGAASYDDRQYAMMARSFAGREYPAPPAAPRSVRCERCQQPVAPPATTHSLDECVRSLASTLAGRDK